MPRWRMREAVAEDCRAINDIYNHYVAHSVCTYQEDSTALEEREVAHMRAPAAHSCRR